MDRSKVLELAHEAELARQFALEVPFVVDRLQRFAALIEREVRGEPVYAFRRKGISKDFCTCSKERYLELSDKPNLFEVKKFYEQG